MKFCAYLGTDDGRLKSWSSMSTLTGEEADFLQVEIDCVSVTDSTAGTELFDSSDEGYEL